MPKRGSIVRSEVITAGVVKVTLWDVTSCSLLNVYFTKYSAVFVIRMVPDIYLTVIIGTFVTNS